MVISPEDGTRLVKLGVGVPGDVIEMRDSLLSPEGKVLEYAALPSRPTRDLEGEPRALAGEDLAGHRQAVMGLPGSGSQD